MKTINPYTLKGGIIMTNMNLLGTALLAGLAAVAGAKAGVAAYSIADEQNKAKEHEKHLIANNASDAWIPCGNEAQGFLIDPVRKVTIYNEEDKVIVDDEDVTIFEEIFET